MRVAASQPKTRRPAAAAPAAAAAPRAAAAAFGRDVRATSANPLGAFELAHARILDTRDPKAAREYFAELEAAYATLKKQGGAGLDTLKARMEAAERRVAALPLLAGLPDIPRPETSRNPETSAKGGGQADAGRARALMNGYGEGATGWRSWLGKLIPGLDRAEATPAFDRLPKAQQARFLKVAEAADAAGQIALHDLLVSERLTPELLGALAGLTTAPLHRGLDRQALLSQAIVELNDPVTISQHARGTCATTSVQILLALESPTTYVQLLAGLASPKGEAALPGGETIRREDDWAADNDGGRSIPSRLMQPAFMELGNGKLDYLNSEDMDLDPTSGEKASSGLTAEQARELLAQAGLNKAGFETQGITYAPGLADKVATGLDETIADARDMLMILQNSQVIDPAGQDRLMAQLKAQASAKRPVYATVIYTLYPEAGRVGFHAVLVTGVKDGMVSYINPWGQEERLPEAQFRTTILSANVRK